MAEVLKTTQGDPSLSSLEPPAGHRISGLKAGENIAAMDACRIGSDGLVYRSSGAAANANANVHGYAMKKANAGAAITLMFNERCHYGEGLVPGKSLYLSGTVAGGLADTPSTGGDLPCAFVLEDGQRIVVRQDVRR